jgi:hypothetical protein
VKRKSPAEAGWGIGFYENHQLKLVAKDENRLTAKSNARTGHILTLPPLFPPLREKNFNQPC